MNKEERIKFIAALVVVGLICLFLGFLYGEYQTLKLGLSISKRFINITFDEDEIAKAFIQYKDNVVNCYGEKEKIYIPEEQG